MPDDTYNEESNLSANTPFESVVRERLSRRAMLMSTAGAAVTAVLGTGAAGEALAHSLGHGHGPRDHDHFPRDRRPHLSFNPVAKSLEDTVSVPHGYRAKVLYRLGDPLSPRVPAFANNGTDPASSFEFRAGDHHDGMCYFGLGPNGRWQGNCSTRGLLCMNHEAITPAYLHPNGQTVVGGVRTVPEEVLREFYVHGVSIVEVEKSRDGSWSYVRSSRFNRRIHTLTPMQLAGPAGGTPSMVTRYSHDGGWTRGTVNNCAIGYTPWGTYLTCEENWAGYFRRMTATDNPRRTAKEIASFNRYGVSGTGRELWATVTPDTPDDLYGRWNTEKLGSSADGSDDYRNVSNTFGWVVEIDPYDRESTPKKRTALGRLGHEGAWVAPVKPGQPVVFYMGDDSRGEYIYKFVSRRHWNPGDAHGGLKAGDKYLDEGTLYAAKFLPDGTGQWLELSFGAGNVTSAYAAYAFADQADVLINARHAADAAGATKMDRPEWGAVDPRNGDVYFTLTNNNSSRSPATVDAANPRSYDDPRTDGTSQTGNPNGHIIRFAESHGRADALEFTWDVYLFGARAGADPANVNLSGLSADNDFSSPDGLWFSAANPGLLWIQTDDGAYTDVTNCMMLAATPGAVGDGSSRQVTSTSGPTTTTVTTYVGEQPGDRNLRRFLVGPKECEITGVTETPDGRALFVNIQHPGEGGSAASPTSHWPDGGSSRPRSATLVITRVDGGVIGIG